MCSKSGDGSAINKTAFERQVFNFALGLNTSSDRTYGMLDLLISEAEFFQKVGQLKPKKEECGAMPDTTDSGTLTLYKLKKASSDATFKAEQTLRAALIAAANTPTSRAALEVLQGTDLLGLKRCSTRAIYEALLDSYPPTTEMELEEARLQMKKKDAPGQSDITALVERIRNGRDLHAAAGQPIPEGRLLALFFSALSGMHPGLSPYIYGFDQLKEYKKTFENAVKKMTKAYADLRDRDAIGCDTAGAAAVLAANAAIAETTRVTAMQREIDDLKETIRAGRTGGKTPGGAPAGGGSAGRKHRYCWIHGLCGHEGKDCLTAKENPPAGFKCGSDVTWENRCGGSSEDKTKNWSDKKRK